MTPYATIKIEVECDHEYGSCEEDGALKGIEIAIQDTLAYMKDVLPAGWTAKEV